MGVKDPGLDMGICLPDSCSDKDVTILIYKCKFHTDLSEIIVGRIEPIVCPKHNIPGSV